MFNFLLSCLQKKKYLKNNLIAARDGNAQSISQSTAVQSEPHQAAQ